MIEALVSIKPRHVDNIMQGKKSVELRVKPISLPPGSRLWVYTTLPVGRIDMSAQVDFVKSLPPEEIWTKYGKEICISKLDFDLYTAGRDLVTAIGLKDITILDQGVCLPLIRMRLGKFQPPQFFSKIAPNSPLLKLLCGGGEVASD
jgi:predicted transcriptional regulator